MADSDSLAQFIGITGASEDAAKFYMESSGGDLQTAVNTFLEGGTTNAGPSAAQVPNFGRGQAAGPSIPPAAPASQPAPAPAARGPPSGTGPRRGARPATGKVRSLADLGDSEDEEDSDEANEYYAGGEKSGQVVKGTPKDGGDEVEGLFDRARQAGARQGTTADLPGADRGGSGPAAFTGAARTLAGGPAASQAAPGPSATPSAPQEHVITFWRNNVFTVDDGEPRSITSPVNREFLDSVVRGECPRELEESSQGAPVNVSLLRRNEDYEPPAQPRHVAFSGAARTLAGPSSTNAAAAPAPNVPDNLTAPSTSWEGVDESEPHTSIQLRLSDGSRMVARFNLRHTVADIRRFIVASRPDMQGPFRLATAFPAAALDNDSATVQEAGLANAVVVQKSA